jgi:perosamine synthetase
LKRGEKAVVKIPVYQTSLTGNAKKYVNECLETNWISSKGKFIPEFEQKFADYIGVKYALAVSNGTVALHLALVSLGIGPEDEVIVPSLTYIASVNSIVYTGAIPVFVDSLKTTWQMNPEDVRKKITTKTKAILVVHLFGHPCEMDELTKIAQENSLFLIEDCAEAIGSMYKGKHVGTFGDIATFSFYGNKTITTGEGGMVITNDDTLHERAIHYRGQGLAKYREYWHDIVGYNYRMTNICAAIGLSQLEQVEEFLAKKRKIAFKYVKGLQKLPLEFHKEVGDVKHSYWMFSILINESSKRDLLRKELMDCGIETRPVFYPIHTMPMYSGKYQKLSIAENISSRGINLPSWPNLADDELNYICTAISNFFRGYS